MAKVIVLGGGVAGMSAAHELIERGFEVEVYDRNTEYFGGKARSVKVPGTNITDPTKFLPGEHGFRFFPGFYKHITDTMKRIPYGAGKTCFDNLIATETVEIAQTARKPIIMPVNFPGNVKEIIEMVIAVIDAEKELTKEEIAFFTDRIWQLMTSCSERYIDQYEQIGWWEYLRADDFSEAYRTLLVEGLTRSLVAAKAQSASTRTVGSIFLQLIYGMINPSSHITDRVLNKPTNDAWLNPWLSYLISKGVKFHLGKKVTALHVSNNQISGAAIQTVNGSQAVQLITGDYYLLATPVEVAAQLINPDMLKVDASLQNIILLAPNVEWMNGIQFYLNQQFDMHKGHTIYANSNWALTSISQMQFWGDYDIQNRYDGTVKGVLSVDISDWTAPGNFNKKAAQDCTLDEVKEEVWKQLQQAINVDGIVLSDEMKRFVHLDADIEPMKSEPSPLMKTLLSSDEVDKLQTLSNKEPLLVNQVNTWTLRPNSFTQIANLYLASDYIKTNTDLATMEGANEAARRAVNNIIEASGSKAALCELWKFDEPLVLDVLKLNDQSRFKKGLSWSNPL
ncbi:MAG: FAD-dependent oxidoreductase [Bacteroidota bacterium]